MRSMCRALPLVLFCLGGGAGFSQQARPAQPDKAGDTLLRKFFSDFNLPAAAEDANMRLRQTPHLAVALFVRMETAELQERPEVVLDSALRLCALRTSPEMQDVASSRVLQHAGNTLVFNSVLRRVKSAVAVQNRCTFNLRLALVAAAWDGASVDLDQAARSAGLLTHWRIVGPFGKYNNVDFERRWTPETEQSLQPRYPLDSKSNVLRNDHRMHGGAKANPSAAIVPERFWFRNGMITMPEYFPSSSVFYAAGDVELAATTRWRVDVLSSGSYEVFVDGKPALLHDALYAAGSSRDSGSLPLTAGQHRILVKFTPDAAPLSVAVHPEFTSPARNPSSLAQPVQEYAQALIFYFRGGLTGMENALHGGALRNAGSSQYLHALLYSAAEDHSPRADAAWKTVAAAQSSALLARLRVAESAAERQQETARPDVMALLAERPQSETALQLAFNLSRRNQVEAPELLSRLLELHPSCARLAEGIKFFSSAAEQDKARRLE
ncbi:MAG TPA: hypothetical protein VF938_01830, partial [Candidatus Angelobacter sp.]